MLSNLDPEKEEAYKRPTRRCACILGEGNTVLQVGSQIEDIKAKIAYFFSRLWHNRIKMQAGEPSSLNETQREQRQIFSDLKHDVIGFDNDLNRLAEFLLREEEGNRVASIFGSKMVYNNPKDWQHFNCYTWVYITQQCQRCFRF